MKTHWQQALESIVNGEHDPSMFPPHMQAMQLPPLAHWREGEAGIQWQASETMHQGSGIVFGGYLAALADYVAGLATISVLDNDENFATVELSTTLIRSVRTETIDVVARVVARNSKLMQLDVQFTDANAGEDEAIIYATARVNQLINRKK